MPDFISIIMFAICVIAVIAVIVIASAAICSVAYGEPFGESLRAMPRRIRDILSDVY